MLISDGEGGRRVRPNLVEGPHRVGAGARDAPGPLEGGVGREQLVADEMEARLGPGTVTGRMTAHVVEATPAR